MAESRLTINLLHGINRSRVFSSIFPDHSNALQAETEASLSGSPIARAAILYGVTMEELSVSRLGLKLRCAERPCPGMLGEWAENRATCAANQINE